MMAFLAGSVLFISENQETETKKKRDGSGKGSGAYHHRHMQIITTARIPTGIRAHTLTGVWHALWREYCRGTRALGYDHQFDSPK